MLRNGDGICAKSERGARGEGTCGKHAGSGVPSLHVPYWGPGAGLWVHVHWPWDIPWATNQTWSCAA